jgi:hypothetical protein
MRAWLAFMTDLLLCALGVACSCVPRAWAAATRACSGVASRPTSAPMQTFKPISEAEDLRPWVSPRVALSRALSVRNLALQDRLGWWLNLLPSLSNGLAG